MVQEVAGDQQRQCSAGAVRWINISVAALVAAQLAVFVASARRGLDLTDEAFYVLSFLHWDRAAAFSFFGAYLQPIYQLLGQNLWGLRVFGFVLLLAAGCVFCLQVSKSFAELAGHSVDGEHTAMSVAAGCAVWNYYAYPVPYTPSYNHLALVSGLLCCALCLRLARQSDPLSRARIFLLSGFLGFLFSAAVCNKFSSGLLMVALCSGVLLAAISRTPCRERAAIAATAILGGALCGFGLLFAADPKLLTRFQQGMAIQWATLPRNPWNEIKWGLVPQLIQASLDAAKFLALPAAAALASSLIARLKGVVDAPARIGLPIFIMLSVAGLYLLDLRAQRFMIATFVAGLVICTACLRAPPGAARPRHRYRLGVVAALIALFPLAFSAGTNNPLFGHMSMAAVFPIGLMAAGLGLLRPTARLGQASVAVVILMVMLPMEVAVRQWFDGRFTYRLGAPLSAQTSVVDSPIVGRAIGVESRTARGLNEFLALVRRAGLTPGSFVVDFTGQSPGLVLVSGGVPLGHLWIVGGGVFQGANAATVALNYVSPADLDAAWLLTSDDSFASVASWREIVIRRTGRMAHVNVGSLVIPDPTSNDKSKSITVNIWQPVLP